MVYGFVILHYMAYEMTCECVDLLLDNFKDNDIHIAIVDNASSNGSGAKLAEKYEGQSCVSVILSKENLGFAKGNNIGYSYLKENFDCDFMIVMNNDVLIRDKSFLDKIPDIYERTEFAVLGPDIINPVSKKHQSPVRLVGYTDAQVKYEINKWEKYLKLIKIYYLRHYIFGWIKRFLPKRTVNTIDYNTDYVDSVLQGACFVFSNNFIKRRQYAFNPSTFLYFEEDILQLECRQSGLKMVFCPQLCVEHLEDISTNAVFNSNYKKDKMKIPEMIKSMKVFLSIYN